MPCSDNCRPDSRQASKSPILPPSCCPPNLHYPTNFKNAQQAPTSPASWSDKSLHSSQTLVPHLPLGHLCHPPIVLPPSHLHVTVTVSFQVAVTHSTWVPVTWHLWVSDLICWLLGFLVCKMGLRTASTGADKIAQSIKCLPHKHEDWRADPQRT